MSEKGKVDYDREVQWPAMGSELHGIQQRTRRADILEAKKQCHSINIEMELKNRLIKWKVECKKSRS